MSGDAHVRFCESLGLQRPGPLDFTEEKGKCEKKPKGKSNRKVKKSAHTYKAGK